VAGKGGEEAWTAWRETLSGHLPALALPLDRPRPRRQSFRGAARAFALDAANTEAVRLLARGERTTSYAVLLSAFAAFLHRVSAQDDLVIGSPTAGRDPGFERAVGYFVNPVPIRADLSGKPSFRQLVGRMRSAVLAAIEHAALPMATMVERTPGARPLDRSPLFQALFALERAHGDPALTPFLTGGAGRIEVPGATLEPLAIEHRASAFDVALVMIEDGACLHGSLRHDTALFSGETADRWAGQFQRLLGSLLSDPDRGIDDAPLAGELESRRCLVEWNRITPEAGGERLFHRLVEEQARQRPDAPAVVLGPAAISYRELDARADALAARLRRLGVGAERPVGVLLERSIDQAVAVLGVLKAGGVYLPLEPGLPDERLRFVLEDARAVAAVTIEALAARAGDLPAVLLDRDGSADGGDRVESLASTPPALHPDGAAYIIYTSGSTGRPKGVVVSHRSACNLADAQRRTFAVVPEHRVLQFASCAFDASFFELSLALTAGASLHVVPSRCLVPGPDLVRLLREGAVTTVTLPPGVLAALPEAELPSIHTVIAAGEACPPELVARWADGRRFFNAYGPTEATVWSTVARLRPPQGQAMRPPIGAPVHGVRAYVLDRALRLAPVGAVGELFVGGASVARGYAGRPALTAGRFVPDPFGPPGARLYRTGDLARWLDDGSIDFLGRVDDQVKIRGFRVEPGEVEAALAALPGLREAAVMARPDRRGETRLVAYLAGDQAVPLDELRALLRRGGLPDHLLPAAAVHLTALPRTPSGKVDRRALPEPVEPVRSAPLSAPSGELEQQLFGVFCEVLGHEQMGADDNFFEVLGGNSLAVVRAGAMLADRHGLEVEVTAIFEHPTIRLLAAHLGRSAGARARTDEISGPGDAAGANARGGAAAASHEERAGARAAALRRRRGA
jgi:amino acid adenylation domain-containing protein